MRCYRCGALMSTGMDTCPDCGFFLNSPVEIRMFEEMVDIIIYDNAKNILWSGNGTGIAYIDAPKRRNIEICWGRYYKLWISVKNGEAYRFERRFSKMARRKGDASLVRTRTIPKRNNYSFPSSEFTNQDN